MIKVKRCTFHKCNKLANNDGVCKRHKCRCNSPCDKHQLFDGCIIHNKNANLKPIIKRD